MLLGAHNYDKKFRIKISTPVMDMDIKDLPSPIQNKNTGKDQIGSELTETSLIAIKTPSKLLMNKLQNFDEECAINASSGEKSTPELVQKLDKKKFDPSGSFKSSQPQHSQKYLKYKAFKDTRVKLKRKGEDYLIMRRKQKDDAKRNVKIYEDHMKGVPLHNDSSSGSMSKAILINGKEFVIRMHKDFESSK